MEVSSPSFGRVIAVSGQSRKIQKITKKLTAEINSGNLMVKNITSFYKYSPSSGEMAQAARKGEIIDLFISGEDVAKIKQKQEGWINISDILSHMQDHINAANMSIAEIVDTILGKGR